MIKEKLLKYLNENPYIYLDEFIKLVHGDKELVREEQLKLR